MKKESKVGSNRKKWTEQEDKLLLNLVNYLGGKWKFISKFFPSKTIFQIYNRQNRINPNTKRGKFTKEEDAKLLELVKSYGKNWVKIASIMKDRDPKQIRSRYVNFLSKNYDDFSVVTEDEKKIIFANYPILGNKWKEYSALLEKKRSPAFVRKVLFKS